MGGWPKARKLAGIVQVPVWREDSLPSFDGVYVECSFVDLLDGKEWIASSAAPPRNDEKGMDCRGSQ